ncbi:Hypothetical protein, conserved [Brucella abortus str. 2308 A]|uniref:Uncharacterized protein n=8 Tax=Brucella TaxID=234 RepID=Q2YNR5_BRUA2|nr:hypothetical protein BR0921 [Brucella suis 1330]AAX74294.1 hypothetical protein BruAb1_0930 [Brucella abortus bv. 1 str. 9-941]ABQ61137.1 hypothetical protein BOV_0915 [Brucella ovis ATCC 25840]ABY38024.1 Hypothetical protein, conserved [Brucella suis ATCC 23445]ACD72398.1 hypothetical protein BAbS19_I08770 [Brucella abortus S19]ACU47906.1 hypothetical protein BMI_I919 [Brucella microti CCM 4915]ADZ86873.1 conserved hypothetical protein [Brucella melitensis M5-90]AEK54246.1 hypothetical p
MSTLFEASDHHGNFRHATNPVSLLKAGKQIDPF